MRPFTDEDEKKRARMDSFASSLLARVLDLIREWLAGILGLFKHLPVPGGGQTVQINDRRFRIIKQLGEGGYAFVYLVREVATAQQPLVEDVPLALKRVNASSRDRLAAAKREVATMRALAHPNCLPLLDHAVCPAAPSGA
ncbi:MAG: hypothetical protein J3K34DRAFT_412989, partial [Monoraphidium minutum]